MAVSVAVPVAGFGGGIGFRGALGRGRDPLGAGVAASRGALGAGVGSAAAGHGLLAGVPAAVSAGGQLLRSGVPAAVSAGGHPLWAGVAATIAAGAAAVARGGDLPLSGVAAPTIGGRDLLRPRVAAAATLLSGAGALVAGHRLLAGLTTAVAGHSLRSCVGAPPRCLRRAPGAFRRGAAGGFPGRSRRSGRAAGQGRGHLVRDPANRAGFVVVQVGAVHPHILTAGAATPREGPPTVRFVPCAAQP
ncbi:MAG TPA: hypothetical protein VGL47_01175 [Amycolatopsis sp.]